MHGVNAFKARSVQQQKMKINASKIIESKKRPTKISMPMATAATSRAIESDASSVPSDSSINRTALSRNHHAVSFVEKARIVLIPSHVDMEQAEKNELWRTEEEIKATEQDIVRSARAIISKDKSNSKGHDNDICERGLEGLICSPDKRHSIRQQRIDLIDAILDVQEKEWQKGHFLANPEMLRAISTKLSSQASKRARMLGASDEACVRRMARRLRDD